VDNGKLLRLVSASILPIALLACNHQVPQPEPPGGGGATPSVPGPTPASGANQIVAKYTALDDANTSISKTRAIIQGDTHLEIQMTMYNKRKPNGRRLILVEFTSPPAERDRDALIEVSPQGDIEATRYAQATGSFITAKNATDEDSLFGLTLQELVGGQNDKYDYKLEGEESFQSKPVYRVTGLLKQGAESRFPRVSMLISKDNFEALQVEAFDNHGELARRMVVNKLEQKSGYWARTLWTVDNPGRKKKIDFAVTDVKYNQNIPDSIFTRDHLKAIASR
jgi:hypothetical protein